MKHRRITAFPLLVCFLAAMCGPVSVSSVQAAGEVVLPAPGTMVPLSPSFNPAILKGIKVHPDNPFSFDFVLSPGDTVGHPEGASTTEGSLKEQQLRAESAKLIKYFLAALTVPEQDLWVNLSPYEKDRIVADGFGKTEMGRDLLAQDYLLKQITASLIYPEDATGKVFWKRIYAEAAKRFGATNVPVNTFNKVWIVPQKAVVYENLQAGTAYVVESRLKVMLEQDYLSLKENLIAGHAKQAKQWDRLVSPEVAAMGSQIVREVVIPQLEKEVNTGKNFAQLRQVYNSLILAAWYKKKIKDSILAQVYNDKNKIAGILSPPNAAVGGPEQIYQRYLQAFKKGAYNYIKEEEDPITRQMIPRKYFSGGVKFGDLAMTTTNQPPDVNGNRDERILTAALQPSTNTMADLGNAVVSGKSEVAQSQGGRKVQEDAYVDEAIDIRNDQTLEHLDLEKIANGKGRLMAVFDGHSRGTINVGDQSVDVSQPIFTWLMLNGFLDEVRTKAGVVKRDEGRPRELTDKQIAKLKAEFHDEKEYARILQILSVRRGEMLSKLFKENLPKLFKQQLINHGGDVEQALNSAFMYLKSLASRYIAGSTAAVLYIPDGGDKMYYSVLGDALVMAVRNDGTHWVAPRHTLENFNNNPEVARIKKYFERHDGHILETGISIITKQGEARSIMVPAALGATDFGAVLLRNPATGNIPLSGIRTALVGSDGLITDVDSEPSITRIADSIVQGKSATEIVAETDGINKPKGDTADNVTIISWKPKSPGESDRAMTAGDATVMDLPSLTDERVRKIFSAPAMRDVMTFLRLSMSGALGTYKVPDVRAVLDKIDDLREIRGAATPKELSEMIIDYAGSLHERIFANAIDAGKLDQEVASFEAFLAWQLIQMGNNTEVIPRLEQKYFDEFIAAFNMREQQYFLLRSPTYTAEGRRLILTASVPEKMVLVDSELGPDSSPIRIYAIKPVTHLEDWQVGGLMGTVHFATTGYGFIFDGEAERHERESLASRRDGVGRRLHAHTSAMTVQLGLPGWTFLSRLLPEFKEKFSTPHFSVSIQAETQQPSPFAERLKAASSNIIRQGYGFYDGPDQRARVVANSEKTTIRHEAKHVERFMYKRFTADEMTKPDFVPREEILAELKSGTDLDNPWFLLSHITDMSVDDDSYGWSILARLAELDEKNHAAIVQWLEQQVPTMSADDMLRRFRAAYDRFHQEVEDNTPQKSELMSWSESTKQLLAQAGLAEYSPVVRVNQVRDDTVVSITIDAPEQKRVFAMILRLHGASLYGPTLNSPKKGGFYKRFGPQMIALALLLARQKMRFSEIRMGIIEGSGSEAFLDGLFSKWQDPLKAVSYEIGLRDGKKTFIVHPQNISWEAVNSFLEADAAMTGVPDRLSATASSDRQNTGGIDLTANRTSLDIKSSGKGNIRFKMDPAQLQELQNSPGFEPVIINIQPMKDLPLFLGAKSTSPSNAEV